MHRQTQRTSDRSRRWLVVLAVSAVCVTQGRLAAADPIFEELPDFFTLTGISHDGTVLSGTSGQRAIRWTDSDGIQMLSAFAIGGSGICEDFPSSSVSNGISGDGNVVVGYSRDDSNRSVSTGAVCADARAAAFTLSSITGLGPEVIIPDSNSSWVSEAHATSYDGSITVGSFRRLDGPFGSNAEAAILVPGGVITLGLGESSVATAVTDDGSMIAGSTGGDPFVWSTTAGLSIIGDGNGAASLSADGVAIAFNRSGRVFRRWLTTGQEIRLVNCGGGFCPSARGISADGATVIMVWPGGPNPSTGYIWQQDLGYLTLTSYLTSHGIDVSGWRLGTGPLFLSADGSTIVGLGRRPDGQSALFRIRQVPEPGTALSLFSGVGFIALLAGVRRGRWRPLAAAGADRSSADSGTPELRGRPPTDRARAERLHDPAPEPSP